MYFIQITTLRQKACISPRTMLKHVCHSAWPVSDSVFLCTIISSSLQSNRFLTHTHTNEGQKRAKKKDKKTKKIIQRKRARKKTGRQRRQYREGARKKDRKTQKVIQRKRRGKKDKTKKIQRKRGRKKDWKTKIIQRKRGRKTGRQRR